MVTAEIPADSRIFGEWASAGTRGDRPPACCSGSAPKVVASPRPTRTLSQLERSHRAGRAGGRAGGASSRACGRSRSGFIPSTPPASSTNPFSSSWMPRARTALISQWQRRGLHDHDRARRHQHASSHFAAAKRTAPAPSSTSPAATCASSKIDGNGHPTRAAPGGHVAQLGIASRNPWRRSTATQSGAPRFDRPQSLRNTGLRLRRGTMVRGLLLDRGKSKPVGVCPRRRSEIGCPT